MSNTTLLSADRRAMTAVLLAALHLLAAPGGAFASDGNDHDGAGAAPRVATSTAAAAATPTGEFAPARLQVSAYYAPLTATLAGFGIQPAGDEPTSPTLARMQYEWHNGRGTAYTFGSGSTEGEFFGLEPSGLAPISLSGARSRFAAPYFALADNTSHVGFSRSLSGGNTVRFGRAAEVPVNGRLSSSSAAADPAAVLLPAERAPSRVVSVFEWQHQSGNTTGVVTLGRMQEGNAVLGISGSGALAIGARPATNFVALAGSRALSERTAVSFMAAWGHTAAFDNRAVSVIDGATGARSGAWSLGVSRNDLFTRGDQFGVSLSMPLKIRSGALRVTTAVAQNQDDGSLVFESRSLALRPTGSQRDIELAYARPLAIGGSMAVLAMATIHPGHDAAAATRWAVGARYVRNF